MVYDLSVTRALWPAMCPSGPRLESVCFRLDGFPCRPNVLADLILSPGEREHWRSMRGVEKRRHEWLLGRCAAKGAVRSLLERTLDLHLSPTEIEIVPDPHGRPQVRAGVPFGSVRGWLQPSLSIAHSHGTAVALTVLDPETRLGIDLESLTHRREDFEATAFSPDERCWLAVLPPDLRQEWALRMWCAKEAVGKALGRGLSAGLLAFHVTRAETASGIIEVELRDGALDQFALLQCKSLTSFGTSPRTSGPVGHGNSEVDEARSRATRALLRCKRLTVYTARECNFVFSAVIYQQGAVRMRPAGDTELSAAKNGRVDETRAAPAASSAQP